MPQDRLPPPLRLLGCSHHHLQQCSFHFVVVAVVVAAAVGADRVVAPVACHRCTLLASGLPPLRPRHHQAQAQIRPDATQRVLRHSWSRAWQAPRPFDCEWVPMRGRCHDGRTRKRRRRRVPVHLHRLGLPLPQQRRQQVSSPCANHTRVHSKVAPTYHFRLLLLLHPLPWTSPHGTECPSWSSWGGCCCLPLLLLQRRREYLRRLKS